MKKENISVKDLQAAVSGKAFKEEGTTASSQVGGLRTARNSRTSDVGPEENNWILLSVRRQKPK